MRPLRSIHDLPDDIRPSVLAIDALFDEIYLVGGAVRDTLMELHTQDLDFATPDNADTIDAKLRMIPSSKVRNDARQFGTIATKIDSFDVQITTYREESYLLNSRHPSIISTVDIDSDLSRRDFTINAIAVSRDKLVDPYDGVKDIDEKTIRAIGDPRMRFQEDPLRILRAFRFVSILGFDIEDKTLKAAHDLYVNIAIVSQERIGIELQRLIQGKYWADAINELADAGILSMILRQLDTPYSVSRDDVAHEFAKHSTSSLEEMGLHLRWLYLIEIIYYAAKSNGVASIPARSIAEKLIVSAQLSKDLKAEILAALLTTESVTLDKRDQTVSTDSRYNDMKTSYLQLKQNKDSRWMIEGAKYYTETGRQHLKDGKYRLAKRSFEHAIKITEENYEFLCTWQSPDKKQQRLRAIKPHYLSRLRYLYIVLILEQNLLHHNTTASSVHKYLRKQITSKYVAHADLGATIDQAIADAYKRSLRAGTPEGFYSFLHDSTNSLTDEDRRRYERDYIGYQLKERSLSPEEKAHLYKRRMEIALAAEDETGKHSLEYYDPYIDNLYNRMLSAKSLNDFNSIYSEYVAITPDYLDLMRRQRTGWDGERNIHLTAAAAHVHALTLAELVDERQSISTQIVEFYELANSTLNANRYRIYMSWFKFASKLLKSSYSHDTIEKLLNILKQARSSIKYADPDEAYLENYRPNIIKKRDLLKDSLSLIASLNDQQITDLTVKDRGIAAIQTLFDSKVLNPKESFIAYKKIVSGIENQDLELDHVDQIDREFSSRQDGELEQLLSGESQTLEYKVSWAFDRNRYIATNSKQKVKDPEITKSAIKNIAGFMNKSGGTLLIGVDDDSNPIGLEQTDFLLSSNKDNRKILDYLQQEIREDILKSLGKEVYSKLSIDVVKYRRQYTVLKISVPTADPSRPCLYKENGHELYFVRSGTTCESMGMQAAFDRVRS